MRWVDRPKLSKLTRKYIFERHEGCCAVCGVENERMQVDHIRPLSQGGEDCTENMRLLCELCHYRRTIAMRPRLGNKRHSRNHVDPRTGRQWSH